MIATFCPDRLTSLTFEEVAESMRAALAAEITGTVRDDVLALALAKSALECARWKSCHNFNFGNAKAGARYAGMYTAFACGENLSDGEWWFTPDGWETCRSGAKKGTKRQPKAYFGPPTDHWHPQTRFRAYASRYDGAYSYVALLVERFPSAYQALWSGDARAFVRALKAARYFTADEEPYARGVISIQSEFTRKLKGIPTDDADLDWEDLKWRVAFAQFSTDELLRETQPEPEPAA